MMLSTVSVQEIIIHGQSVAKADAFFMTTALYASVPYGACLGRQGDIYLWKLAGLPEDAIEVEPYRQLAPGATRGSRHCLDALTGVRMFHRRTPGPLDGPILWLSVPRTLTHPTHGDIVGLPAGAILKITYQRLYADEVRRVED